MRRALLPSLVCVGSLAACGKDPGRPAAPRPVSVEPPEPEAGTVDGTGETGEPEPAVPRLELETELHRTRFGLGTGLWALGMIHNAHAERVADVRVEARMLDADAALVGRAEARLGRALGPGERAAVAVPIREPVVHERLSLHASAIVDEGPAPEPVALRLEHEPPARAEFGGWYVVGRIENTGSAPIHGARIEVLGLDEAGKLLGIDWLDLDPIDGGETVEFDVGELRYEEQPEQLVVELRGPSPR